MEGNHERCKFPSWVASHHHYHWHSLDNAHSYHFTHKNATLKVTREHGPTEMRLVCHHVVTNSTATVMLVAHVTAGWYVFRKTVLFANIKNKLIVWVGIIYSPILTRTYCIYIVQILSPFYNFRYSFLAWFGWCWREPHDHRSWLLFFLTTSTRWTSVCTRIPTWWFQTNHFFPEFTIFQISWHYFPMAEEFSDTMYDQF